MEIKDLDNQIEKVLETTTVSRAQEIMGSRSGRWLIAVISFFESATPLPFITDPFMAAAIVINRAKYLETIFVTTIASVLGGMAAYFTAYFFFDLALSLLAPEAAATLMELTAQEEANVFLFTLVGAFTPIPYTLTAWAVGALEGNLTLFIVASFIGRGARYAIIGFLTYQFGPAAVKIARRYIGISSIVLLLLAGFVLWYKM